MVEVIDAKQLQDKLMSGAVYLVDVRTPAEHRGAAIKGSVLLPLDQLSAEQLPEQDLPVVFYCRLGRRSMVAAERVQAQRTSWKILSLEGGIEAWKAAGCPVESQSRDVLPVDRQTQITIGAIVLLGTLLGIFVHAGFLLLPLFMGAGLIFAGVSGWCGLAKLLAVMPWNQ